MSNYNDTLPSNRLAGWDPVETEVEQWSIFIGLHASSVVLLSTLCVLIWWSRVKRPPVVIMMYLGFIINSASNLIAIGDTLDHSMPRPLALVGYVFSLCGTTVIAATSCATTVFVWATLQRSFGRKVYLSAHMDHILLIFPWVLYFSNMVFGFVWDTQHPEDLHISLLGGYSYGAPTIVWHFVVAVVICFALVIDVWAAILVFKNRQIARQTSIIGASQSSNLNYPFIIRVLVFGLANAGGLITALLCYTDPMSHAPALYQASCGPTLALTFGSQADVFIAIWHKFYPPPDPVNSPPLPPIRRSHGFGSGVGRLSTFFVSITTHHALGRRTSTPSDLESLGVPNLMHSELSTASEPNLETPKQDIVPNFGDKKGFRAAESEADGQAEKRDKQQR